MSSPVTSATLPFPLVRRGKVRDVYAIGENLLLVATDRISAFDVVLVPGIPEKGEILTRISNYWFSFFSNVRNHLVETDFDRFPPELRPFDELRGRSVIVQRCEVVPVECVARGYLAGSGWKEYLRSGTVCGIELPRGLPMSAELSEPIFTPATKAEEGHDENINFETMEELIGGELAVKLRELTLRIYGAARRHARERGIIIADTKFEFGIAAGEIVWIDEALTPDSSRFWPEAEYRTGENPPSFDKQFVRDWLESTGWDKSPPAPELPPDVVAITRERYFAALRLLTEGKLNPLT